MINGQNFVSQFYCMLIIKIQITQIEIEFLDMISDYIGKINDFLKTDEESIDNSLDYGNSMVFEIQLKKSAQYLQTLRKNSHKIEQLIMENDRLKHENSLHLKTIQMHLKKQLQLKYAISNLQQQLQILTTKLITTQQKLSLIPSTPSRQTAKLLQKLQNCIQENQILRQQNQLLSYKQNKENYLKQENYRYIEQKFKQTINSLNDQVITLKTELQYNMEKANLLEKVQAENHLLKLQVKRITASIDIKIQEYQSKINRLVCELDSANSKNSILQSKYQELTQVIQLVDSMRHQYKSKKQSLQYAQQTKKLLNPIQFNPNFAFINEPISSFKQKTIVKNVINQNSKENKLR